MFTNHFYNQTTRKTIAVFGSLFNNINVVRKKTDGEIISEMKVPLAYGPKKRFLERINQEDLKDGKKIAIRLPRMSFEIVSIDPSPDTQLSLYNTQITSGSKIAQQGTKYDLTFSLTVMAAQQGDALQIIEQILPYFRPTYTLAVNGFDPMGSIDMPVTLTSGPTPNVDYEGDFQTSRQTVLYEMTFTVPAYYSFGHGDDAKDAKRIRTVTIDLYAGDKTDIVADDRVKVAVGALDTPESYTITTTFGFDE